MVRESPDIAGYPVRYLTSPHFRYDSLMQPPSQTIADAVAQILAEADADIAARKPVCQSSGNAASSNNTATPSSSPLPNLFTSPTPSQKSKIENRKSKILPSLSPNSSPSPLPPAAPTRSTACAPPAKPAPSVAASTSATPTPSPGKATSTKNTTANSCSFTNNLICPIVT